MSPYSNININRWYRSPRLSVQALFSTGNIPVAVFCISVFFVSHFSPHFFTFLFSPMRCSCEAPEMWNWNLNFSYIIVLQFWEIVLVKYVEYFFLGWITHFDHWRGRRRPNKAHFWRHKILMVRMLPNNYLYTFQSRATLAFILSRALKHQINFSCVWTELSINVMF